MKNKIFLILLLIGLMAFSQEQKKLKIGIIGLSHSHVHWLLGGNFNDVEIVGIVEADKVLAKRLMNQYKMSMNLVYNSMDEMIEKSNPEAVSAFGSIYEHLEVVEKCAPLGIHIMVEKPLAVSMEHAKKMRALADKHKVYLLTNYETTWYPTNHKAYDILQNNQIGNPVRVVVNDGHQGPQEIGVNQEFLDWLTDPILNGGGAIMDFGCYGANLITWLMKGEKPISVMAKTRQLKPDIYPKVDDDATIILTYPEVQGLIQASWNWPYSRKDMAIYGKTGAVFAETGTKLRLRFQKDNQEKVENLKTFKHPFDNPFSYFRGVIRGEIELQTTDLSSLENNMIVVEILEAAKESADKGQVIYLK